jgi:hypothetical protein
MGNRKMAFYLIEIMAIIIFIMKEARFIIHLSGIIFLQVVK